MSVAGFKEAQRLRDLDRAKRDLYWLVSDVLGYAWNPKLKKGMVEHFHRPLCDWWREHEDESDAGIFLERGGLKTTIFTVGDICQQFLIDPNIAICVVHAVEDKALEILDEVRNIIATNSRYRALLGEAAPHPNSKKWYKSDKITLNRTRYQRSPSLYAAGVNTEITGTHVQRFYLDDIIARSTIENSQIPRVKSWLRNTLEAVLDPGGKLRVVGTRWDTEDPYQDMIDDPKFKTLVVPCKTDDGTIFGHMDYKGKPVYYGPDPGDYEFKLKRLKRLERKMGGDFAPQMMNDPSPAGEKPWSSMTCEHFIEVHEAGGPGVVVVLSDPAPAKTGSVNDQMSRMRGDGSKDDWAIAVVKYRRREQRNEIILLDGAFSKNWTLEQGFEHMCQFQRKWSAKYTANEATGQAIALFDGVHRQIARNEGVSHRPIKLSQTYRGKNIQFAALAAKAQQDEFLISKSVPPEFLEKFLEQARGWRPIGTGKNSLRFDDCANVVSFACDPAIPKEIVIPRIAKDEPGWSPFRPNDQESDYGFSTRYIAC